MVSLAYCKVKNISAIQTAPLTLMATVHPKKPSLPGRLFHIWMYAEGLFTECTDQFQQELTVNNAEGSQHDQGKKDQCKKHRQSASRGYGDLRREERFHRSRHSSRDTRGITSLSFRIYAKHNDSTTDDHHIAS